MIVAIHQPNFLPWLGYFDKIVRSDVFVFLDQVQHPKTGGTWTNRVRIAKEDEPSWLTVAIDRSHHGAVSVAELRAKDDAWTMPIFANLKRAYEAAPFFHETMAVLEPLLRAATREVAAFNQRSIVALCEWLRLRLPKFVVASSLGVEGKATELLIKIVKATGGTTYLCGGGATGYQEDQMFAEAGIQLRYQNFSHPEYSRGAASTFTAGLSIVDALMHVGPEGTRQLLCREVSSSIPNLSKAG